MKKFLRKYFIPHEGNEHKPHILRLEAILVLVASVLIVEVFFLLQVFVFSNNPSFVATVVPDVLITQTNENRIEFNVTPLKINPLLEEAARMKAEDMAKNGYFAHTSPSGLSPWYWFEKAGYTFSSAGENLAVNFINSDDVTEAWMNSTGHRKNILNDKFTEVGIATAQGNYKGEKATFVVQFFGRQLPKTALAGNDGNNTSPTSVSPTESVQPVFNEKDELFVEVEGVAETETTAEENVALSPVVDSVSFVKFMLASPITSSKTIYFSLGAIILLALIFKIFVNIKIQHPPLIVNGILLLIIISSVVLANEYIGLLGANIA